MCCNLGKCEWMDESRDGRRLACIIWLKGGADLLIRGWMDEWMDEFLWN